MKKGILAVLALLAVSAGFGFSARAQTVSVEGEAERGRTFALQACTGCHLVAPNQPFKPIYTGTPRPPDFAEIANRPNITSASLQHHLQTLPAVPKDSLMANPMLSNEQLRQVVAFIITLRNQPANSAR